MSNFLEFYNTRNTFINSIGYDHPLTYEEWQSKPEDLKAAFLFVQFYNEITLAWDKADSLDYGDDSEGVFTILQYLRKQISTIQYFQKDDPTKKASAEFRRKYPDKVLEVEKRRIDEDRSKFSPGYIYRVAYNCLYCICGHDRQHDKDIINNETSSIVIHDGEEINLFDTIIDHNNSIENVVKSNAFEKEFWSVIEDEGLSAEKVMRYLLSQDKADLKSLNKKNKLYKYDPLRDVEVSLEEAEKIITNLRNKFLSLPTSSTCGQYISKMADVL